MVKEIKRKKLVLVDGHAIIHRAFHAVPENLSTRAGEPTNATFGFTSMLMKALLEEKPDYVAMTFDRPAPTFRHQEYAPYKAHRPTLPDNMRPQFNRIREMVEAFGIQIYEKDGYEADDVLGTLSVQARAQGVETIIYTGDMDTLQLVNANVIVKVAKRGISEVTEYNVAEVEARYGFPPVKLPDYKGLVGDKSDNIPGVAGIGEKTARRLISDYGSLEGVLERVGELKAKDQKLLRDAASLARQSKHLATIVLDAPVQLNLEACQLTHVDSERVLNLFRTLEFRNLVDRVLSLFQQLGLQAVSESGSGVEKELAAIQSIVDEKEALLYAPPTGMVPIITPPLPPEQAEFNGPTIQVQAVAVSGATVATTTVSEVEGPQQLNLFEVAEPHTEIVHRLRLPSPGSVDAPLFLEDENEAKTSSMIIDTESALQVLVKSLSSSAGFAFDTETTSEDPRHAELVGLSFSMAAGEAYYIPVGHIQTVDGQTPSAQLPLQYVLEKLKSVLEDEVVPKYMHNSKYDMAILERYRIILRGLSFDTMLGAYLAEPGKRGGLGLKDQTFQRLGHVMTPINALIGSGSKVISMAQVPIRKAADYAGADADMTLRLVEPIRSELQRHGLLDLYYRVEQPLIRVLMQMELHGVALDADFLREYGSDLDKQLGQLEQAIYDAVGHKFNVNSTKQLGEVLYVELGLPAGKKNKTGYSVSADVIESLRGKHEIIDHLLAYRQLSKLKSTYVDGLLALMDRQTGRVYTSFNQTVASSGRLSSSNPNLQNIPVRTELGRRLRLAFIADPSYVLLTADYSQFELRILASITREPRLLEAFKNGEDIHTITASSLFNVPADQVTRDQRRLAKTVVFAVLYGQSAFGLSLVTGMTNAESAEFIKRYHETFPNVKGYVDSILNQARTQGYVNTLYGRKRLFPNMRDLPHNERQALEREAINMPIQGSNADLIKMAMLRIHHELKERGMKTRMIIQVHDELVFEVPREELERTKRLVKSLMEGVGKDHLNVPVEVELKVGRNWYEAEPMV